MNNSEFTFDSSQFDSFVSAYGLNKDILEDGFQLISVNTFEDIVADDSVTSLREAITFANNTADNVIILLNPGTYTLTITGEENPSDPNSTGDLDILGVEGRVAIVGIDDSEDILIDAQNLGDRVFDIQESADVTIANLTITGGQGSFGGAILNFGTLTVTESNFVDNKSLLAGGGAIFNDGTLTVTESNFADNFSNFGGGAIASNSMLVVTESNFVGNKALLAGGAITNRGTAEIVESNFTDNSSDLLGGAIENLGTLVLSKSTFKNNSAELGGAIYNFSGAVPPDGDEFYGILLVIESTFENNLAQEGGAIYNQALLVVTESQFLSNKALYGDAIYNDLNSLLVPLGRNKFEKGSIWISGKSESENA